MCLWRPNELEEHDDATKKTRPTTFRPQKPLSSKERPPPPSSSSRLEKSQLCEKGFGTTRDGGITRERESGTLCTNNNAKEFFQFQFCFFSSGFKVSVFRVYGKKSLDRNPIPLQRKYHIKALCKNTRTYRRVSHHVRDDDDDDDAEEPPPFVRRLSEKTNGGGLCCVRRRTRTQRIYYMRFLPTL